MLEAIFSAKKTATANYIQRVKRADEFGDKGLTAQSEGIVRNGSCHAKENDRILRD